MSETAYTSHPLRSSIEKFLELAENDAFSAPSIAENIDHAFARDKIFGMINLIAARLDQSPATLTSLGGLNSLHASLQPVINELTHFITNKNPGHLVNAANQIDQGVLPLLWVFPTGIASGKPAPMSRFVEEIRRSAQQTIEILNKQKAELEVGIKALSSEITAHQAKLEALGEAVAAQKADALAVKAQVQKEYADSEAARSAMFLKTLEEFKGLNAELDASTREAARALIVSLTNSKEDAARIVEAVGNTGITGNYKKIADSEAKQANLWRGFAIAFFSIGVIIAILTFNKFLEGPSTTENALTTLVRLLFAFAIASPAWYIANESARHRSSADRARQIELELASLNPYIELMDNDKKQQIKEQLIGKYFGNVSATHEAKPPISSKEFKDLVAEAFKSIPSKSS
jgi:hypothetical protein